MKCLLSYARFYMIAERVWETGMEAKNNTRAGWRHQKLVIPWAVNFGVFWGLNVLNFERMRLSCIWKTGQKYPTYPTAVCTDMSRLNYNHRRYLTRANFQMEVNHISAEVHRQNCIPELVDQPTYLSHPSSCGLRIVALGVSAIRTITTCRPPKSRPWLCEFAF